MIYIPWPSIPHQIQIIAEFQFACNLLIDDGNPLRYKRVRAPITVLPQGGVLLFFFELFQKLDYCPGIVAGLLQILDAEPIGLKFILLRSEEHTSELQSQS